MTSDDYRVDYAEITRVYRTERKESLIEIPPDFYERAHEYILSLERAEKEAGEAGRDMLNTAHAQIRESKKLLNNIWEFRTRKLLLIAVSQRKNASFEPKGLAREEKEFLLGVLSSIRDHESSSLHSVSAPRAPKKERAKAEVKVEAKAEEPEPVSGPPADVKEQVQHPPPAASEKGGSLVMLRCLENAPRFATEFGEFDLRKEDVAFLPAAYSRVLIDRKVAAPIGER